MHVSYGSTAKSLTLLIFLLMCVTPIYAMEKSELGPERLTEITGLTWSPNEKEFVFASNRDYEDKGKYLWRVGIDGNGLTQITFPGEDKIGKIIHYQDGNPLWSPDGTKIAFDSDRGETRQDDSSEKLEQVFVCDRHGKELKQISSGQGWFRNKQPAWSPDGKHIAWTTSRNGSADIMLVTADGKEVRYLAVTAKVAETYPSWSGDGKHIAFIAQRERVRDYSTEASLNIYVRGTVEEEKPQITKPKVLLTISSNFGLVGVCSPVGDTLAYVDPQLQVKDLWLIKLDGSGKRRLTNFFGKKMGVTSWTRPAWSPDGKRIAFVAKSRRALAPNIYEQGIWICNISDGSVVEVPLPSVEVIKN